MAPVSSVPFNLLSCGTIWTVLDLNQLRWLQTPVIIGKTRMNLSERTDSSADIFQDWRLSVIPSGVADSELGKSGRVLAALSRRATALSLSGRFLNILYISMRELLSAGNDNRLQCSGSTSFGTHMPLASTPFRKRDLLLETELCPPPQ
jgi:hypothetical protein